MTSPEEKERSRVNRRNFIAKKMRESSQYKERTLDARKSEYKRVKKVQLNDPEDEE